MGKELDQSRLGSTARLRRMRFALGTLARQVYSPLGHVHTLPFRKRADALVEPVKLDVEGVTWFAVRVAHGYERDVADDLAAVGFRTYCPLGRDIALQARLPGGKRGRRVRQFPAFAHYIFVGCRTGDALGKHSHDRIEGIVGDGRAARAIAPKAMAALNALELAGEWDATRTWSQKSPLQPGRSVRLIQDLFALMPATVAELLSPTQLYVDVSVGGRTTRVKVATCQVEPV